MPPFLTEFCQCRGLFRITFVWLWIFLKQWYLRTLMLCLCHADGAHSSLQRALFPGTLKHLLLNTTRELVTVMWWEEISLGGQPSFDVRRKGWWGVICRVGASTSLYSRRKGNAARWTWLEASVPSSLQSLSSHGPCKEVWSLPNVWRPLSKS